MERSSPLLELSGVTRTFGAVTALDDVSFDVHAGEVVALVGDNGAGKSTLVKVMSGSVQPDEARITFEDRPVRIDNPQAAAGLGIATVYQDLALCDNLDVVANLYLGREHTRSTVLSELRMEQTAGELLTELSVRIPSLRTPVAALSGGQRQSIAIARCLLGDPRVVLLDEPTAALGLPQKQQVLELLRKLRTRGLGVVLISHNLAEVFAVADRVIVLRLGRHAATLAAVPENQDKVVAAITGAAKTASVGGFT